MKYTEIAQKSREELEKMLKEKKTELFELKLKLKTMQLTNPNEIRACRKDIARIKTAINAQKNA
ncbi:50S ribosomal protein L29 [Hydrogenimonas sp.]